MKISRHVELMLELQAIHGDIDVHIAREDHSGSYDLDRSGHAHNRAEMDRWTEAVSEVRNGRPISRGGSRGTAIVAVIEGE